MTSRLRAFVTGGASGIGAACARRLHARGARVIIADIAVGAAEELAPEALPEAPAEAAPDAQPQA